MGDGGGVSSCFVTFAGVLVPCEDGFRELPFVLLEVWELALDLADV